MAKSVLLTPEARLVEVILFLENEPVRFDKLLKMTNLKESVLKDALKLLAETYKEANHGLELVDNEGVFNFLPSEDLHESLRASYGKKVDRRLSKAALETLSIIAYSQPTTRREVENIRGVASDNIIRLLREREYVTIVGRKEVPGYPALYGTTTKFLYEFNLPSISALPKLSDIDKERFEASQEQIDET